MKNYDDMSDFEINRAVAIVEDIDGDIEFIEQRITKIKCLNYVAIVKLKGIDDTASFSPCNNPSDAWPIIVENKIGVQFFGDDWMSFVHNVASRHFCYNKNPLRAAMICFLKMKDAEQ